jgi:hypothetical protein
MTRTTQITLSLVAALTLASCSSNLSRKDCEEKDFYAQGLEDGKSGKSTERQEKIRNSCGDYGLTNAFDRYDYGRKVGMAQYCDEDRAKDDVKAGKTDSICMKENIPPYQTAYQKALDQKREDKRKELDALHKQQDKLQKKTSAAEKDLNQM